jgi:hypothetical protein
MRRKIEDDPYAPPPKSYPRLDRYGQLLLDPRVIVGTLSSVMDPDGPGIGTFVSYHVYKSLDDKLYAEGERGAVHVFEEPPLDGQTVVLPGGFWRHCRFNRRSDSSPAVPVREHPSALAGARSAATCDGGHSPVDWTSPYGM